MSKKMKGKFKASKEYIALEKFIQKLEPGTNISWMEIQHQTEIIMNQSNRQKLRAVMAKHRIEYIPVHGEGIHIASAKTGVEVVGRKLIRVDNSVKRAERSNVNILKKFRKDMANDDQLALDHTAAVFGAIRAYSKNAKTAFKEVQQERAEEVKVGIPSGSGKWY